MLFAPVPKRGFPPVMIMKSWSKTWTSAACWMPVWWSNHWRSSMGVTWKDFCECVSHLQLAIDCPVKERLVRVQTSVAQGTFCSWWQGVVFVLVRQPALKMFRVLSERGKFARSIFVHNSVSTSWPSGGVLISNCGFALPTSHFFNITIKLIVGLTVFKQLSFQTFQLILFWARLAVCNRHQILRLIGLLLKAICLAFGKIPIHQIPPICSQLQLKVLANLLKLTLLRLSLFKRVAASYAYIIKIKYK